MPDNHTTALEELRDWLISEAITYEHRAANERREDHHNTARDLAAIGRKYRQRADALSTALSLLAEREWRPIETAPKDGTWILCWDSGSINEAKYVAHEVCKWRSCGRSSDSGPGWYNSHLAKQQRVTHWMPLPAAPQPPKGEGDE